MAESNRFVAVAGHPGIYRKGSSYVVKWRHAGRMRSKSFRTLSEAKAHKGATNAGATKSYSRELFPKYADRWLESYTGRTASGLSASTRRSYADALNRMLKPYFARTRMDQIDAPAVRDLVDHLSGRGLAAATVRRYVAPLRALLATAYEDGVISSIPKVRVVVAGATPDLTNETSKTGPDGRRKRLSAEQTKALLAAMPESHADLGYFLAQTGCRISEALAVCWGDIDTRDGKPVIRIPKSKTAAGLRTLGLTPEHAQRLMARRARTPYAGADDRIFGNDRGLPLDPHNYRSRVFRPAARAAGVPWATPHDLRHGLATLMAANGWGPAQIASWLGHADGGVLALKTYIHVDAEVAPEWLGTAFV